MIRNPLLPPEEPGGEWLMPMYYTPTGQGHVSDQWSSLKRSRKPESSWPLRNASKLSSHGTGLVQPSVVRMPFSSGPGKPAVLRAYFRDRSAAHIHTSMSTNGGFSWSSPEAMDIPNNNKAVFAAALPSGRVALLFNNLVGQSRGKRLTIALSEDGGKTFPIRWDVQNGVYNGGFEFSYPSLAADPHLDCDGAGRANAKDSALHISYTYSKPGQRGWRYAIRYLCVRESFLLGLPRRKASTTAETESTAAETE